MISNMMIINSTDVTILENDGLGFCLITAFFQGLQPDESRLQEKERETSISDAMKFVVDNEESGKDELSDISKATIGTWYTKYRI